MNAGPPGVNELGAFLGDAKEPVVASLCGKGLFRGSFTRVVVEEVGVELGDCVDELAKDTFDG
jgi:hypothetical protein